MTNKIYERNFGSDPEFFVIDNKSYQGSFLAIPPAALFEDYKFPLIGETNNGKRIFFQTDDVNFIEDGVAIELNFKKPINSPNVFSKIIVDSKSLLNNYLFNLHRYLSFSTAITVKFDTEIYGENRGESFLDCIRFGCDRDYRPEIYKEFDKGCSITDSSKHSYRYAGGHFHIQNMSKDSYVYIDQIETFPLVLDLFIGTINTLFSRDSIATRNEKKRLAYFGFPGRYRIQDYGNDINGVEYRPPSNVWVNYPHYVKTMFEVGNICGNIIENRLTDEFIPIVMDNLKPFYYSLINFEKDNAKIYLYKAIEKALDLNIINISNLTHIKSGISF